MRPFTHSREAVRIKVKKYNGKLPAEIQKFSVDPQITSLDVLQSILIKAFNIKHDFSLSYKIASDGQDEYTGLFSDWDLDAAFLRAQNVEESEPCVHLRVDVKNHSVLQDGQGITNSKLHQKNFNAGILKNASNATEQKTIHQLGLQGILMNQMEKTLSMVSRALNFSDDPDVPVQPPLSDTKFRAFLDPVGQVINDAGLREVIYSGGIDPSLRRVVWKHILNVYPEGMSGKQRMDYMKRKSLEYYSLRDVWRDCIHKGQVPSDLMYVTSMVKKDVLRTDRHHKFYAGSDDNQNIASLFNILTTYALNHPLVSYCQGMSDLASPLLVTMGDEAHAYICFCALMARLYPNFLLDGEAMTLKFSHLTESLQVYDPEFYMYLKNQQADDLLFCYRWLLLEMKREFAFDDALRMLEVLWSSLSPHPPKEELLLKEKPFCPTQCESEAPISPLVKSLHENAYTKLCAIRRQHSSVSLSGDSRTRTYKRMNQSLDENIGKKCASPTSLQLSKEFQSLDDAAINTSKLGYLSGGLYKDKSKTVTYSSNSVASSEEPELDNYSELMDEDLLCTPDNHVLYGSKEPLIKTNSLSLLTQSTEKLPTSGSPVMIIENFNEFKKLSLYARRNKSSVNKENSWGDNSNEVVQVGHDNPLKESEYEDSSPDDSKDYSLMTTSMTTELKRESDNFDRIVCNQCAINDNTHYDPRGVDRAIQCSHLDCNGHLDDVKDTTPPTKSTDSATSFSDNFDRIVCHQCAINDNTQYDPRGVDRAIQCSRLDCNGHLDDVKDTTPPTKSTDSATSFSVSFPKASESVFLWENPLHEKVQGVDDLNFLNVNRIDDVKDSGSNGKCTPAPSTSKVVVSNTFPRHFTKSHSKFFSNMSQELENARKNCEILLNNKKASNLHSIAVTISNFQNKCENQPQHPPGCVSNDLSGDGRPSNLVSVSQNSTELSESESKHLTSQLFPPPQTFGGGNPFLMFLCLTVLMQHRDHIMSNRMDYNELAMHFDKMVRKHNVNRVLNQARQMYSQYLKQVTSDSK